MSLTYSFVFLDFSILFLRAFIHHFLLRSYFLGFSVDSQRFSVMMVVKDAVNLSTLVFSLHIFSSRSKLIEYFAIRLERWSRSINWAVVFISTTSAHFLWATVCHRFFWRLFICRVMFFAISFWVLPVISTFFFGLLNCVSYDHCIFHLLLHCLLDFFIFSLISFSYLSSLLSIAIEILSNFFL